MSGEGASGDAAVPAPAPSAATGPADHQEPTPTTVSPLLAREALAAAPPAVAEPAAAGAEVVVPFAAATMTASAVPAATVAPAAPAPATPAIPAAPADAAAPAAGKLIRLATVDGGDPLVKDFATRFRATCAMRTFSWLWLFLGLLAAIGGGLLGNHLAGPVPPLIGERGPLAHLLNDLLGNPGGVLLGMVGGAFVASTLGVLANRRSVPTGQEPWFGFLIAVLVYLPFYDPLIALGVVGGGLTLVYFAFRLLALAVGGNHGFRTDQLAEPVGGWPMYTVLVPLYKERNVARNILVSLGKLDYPRDRLDVKFLLEADDPDTLQAISDAGIPPWAEVIVVPAGQPKTKPRACNHGLATAKGDFLVIFDAEDRPEPDQLKQAVHAFASMPVEVACLQAQLAYHNHRQNMLTRWFALEYNVWFRRYLSGLVALGVPIPLGGTSNHFRTGILRQIGGWDPFNVTEDCDLGVRLYMQGFHTRTLDSTTWEEANSRVGNWIRQRSRWLKGYMITHLVWARRPWLLVWKLNPWGALGFLLSVFCVSCLSAVNLVLWVISGIYLTLVTIDLSHGHGLWELLSTRDEAHERLSWQMVFSGRYEDPSLSQLSQVFFAASVCLMLGNIAFILINALAGRRPGQRGLWFAAFISPLYWILISIAAWKGLWQLVWKPHYWEKTVHGLDEEHPQA
jgi:cellulose synthase/poly-beta-1,6-N-acetylglucosamine synthase-like glycosyltransferase